MPLDWTDGALMVPAGCLPCCPVPAPTPSNNYCECLFYFPFDAAVFANYNTANTAISTQTNNCIAYVTPSKNVFTASSTLTYLNVSANTSANYQHIWASITTGANTSLNVAFDSNAVAGNNTTSINVTLNVYYCNGTRLSTNSNVGAAGAAVSGSFVPPVITVPGQYYLNFYTLGFTGATGVNSNWSASSNQNMAVNPAVALWDDNGTTRKLWACPKLILPPRTENTADWYVDCTSANSELTAAQYVSNCVGYCADLPDTFTATDGGTTLTLASSCDLIVDPRYSMWGGINAVAGQTLSASFTYVGDHGAATAGFTIFDDEGVQVETMSGAGGTLTSSALPYTGRYTIRASGGRNDGVFSDPFTVSATISSTGTMSVNPIQARYDLGLTCSATLDCGANCP